MVTRVSRTEAARHLGVSISTIDRRIQRGELSVEKKATGVESGFMCFSMRTYLHLQLQTHRCQQVQPHAVALVTLLLTT